MSATTPDVPLHPHTDRWVFRSSGESGRVSRAERRGVYGDDEARRACADASEKPDLPWHRTTSSSRILTLRRCRVKAFLSLGEFAHDATAGIFNDYVALQVWAGTPVRTGTSVDSREFTVGRRDQGPRTGEVTRDSGTGLRLVGWGIDGKGRGKGPSSAVPQIRARRSGCC